MMTVFAQEWSIKLRPSWTSILHLPQCYGYPSRRGLAGVPNPIYSSVWRKWLSAVCAVAPIFILHLIMVFCEKGIKVVHLLGGGGWSTLHTMLGVKIPTVTWMVKARVIMIIMIMLGLFIYFPFSSARMRSRGRLDNWEAFWVPSLKPSAYHRWHVCGSQASGWKGMKTHNTQHAARSSQFIVHSS